MAAELKIVAFSFKDLLKHPYIVIPTLFLLFLTIAFSRLSVIVNYKLSNNLEIISWLVFYSLASLLVISYIFSGLIFLCRKIIKKEKFSFRDFFSSSNKLWLKNFAIVIITWLAYNIMRVLVHYSSFSIGRILNLSVEQASFVFYLLYFLGLALIIIYLALASFALIALGLPIRESIKKSVRIVQANYLFIFSIFVISFIINKFISYINNSLIQEVINSILIVPLLALILTKVVLSYKGK